MTIEVRLFAALRDAAGEARTTSEADTVGALLDELRQRYGEPFTQRLARSKVVVDGDEADPADSLQGAREVALLPPFSGG